MALQDFVHWLEDLVVETVDNHAPPVCVCVPDTWTSDATQFKIAEDSNTAEKFAELVLELHPKLCNSTLRALLQETPVQAFLHMAFDL